MLRSLLDAVLETIDLWSEPGHPAREEATRRTVALANRFTAEATIFAVNQQMSTVTSRALAEWLGEDRDRHPRNVGVINPGNIPFAEFQDFLAVTLSGHRYLGKVSSRSPHLLPAFADDLRTLYPELDAEFLETDQLFARSDAIVLSGNNDTIHSLVTKAREIGMDERRILARGHRYSVAVIGLNDSTDTFERLAEDALLHDGLGCRSPVIIWAPRGQSPDAVLETFARFRSIFPAHEDTVGSLKLQIAFHIAVGTPMGYGDDHSFLVTRGDPEPQHPGHVRWVEYADLREVNDWINSRMNELQIVSAAPSVRSALQPLGVPVIDMGNAQRPELGWHQDGKDVLAFLRSLP